MKSVYFYTYKPGKNPVCNLGIAEKDGCISGVLFGKDNPPEGFTVRETPLIKKAAAQFDEYFAGKRKEFDLPLALHGTDFQAAVWKALQQIPFGKTRSYKEIAAAAGNDKASRAVGMVNNRNPIVIIIPCHRVIGSNGSLTGFAGGLELKQALLDLEREVGSNEH